MPILTWDDDYSVGVKRIDDEHKTLIDMINKAYDAADSQDDLTTLSQLANDMRQYALLHFATEEELMRIHRYPASKTHHAKHEDFLEKANTCSQCATGLDITNPIEMIKYLADWLNNHILGTDKKLGKFLNEQGIH